MVMMKRTKGEADLRGGGTSSARMTAPLVAVSAVVRTWLDGHGVNVEAHLGAIGSVEAASMNQCPPRWANQTCRNCVAGMKKRRRPWPNSSKRPGALEIPLVEGRPPNRRFTSRIG